MLTYHASLNYKAYIIIWQELLFSSIQLHLTYIQAHINMVPLS
jgi:hypothetical protein